MIIELLLIAFSVALDVFAISIGKGLASSKVRPSNAVSVFIWFGGFHLVLPLIGYLVANKLSEYITSIDHWIILFLLTAIGVNMIYEAISGNDCEKTSTDEFNWQHMLPLSLACSLDGLAVGISFAFMDKVNIVAALFIMPLVTGILSVIGLYCGHKLGDKWEERAQIAGGIVLILIGIKTFSEHMGFINF